MVHRYVKFFPSAALCIMLSFMALSGIALAQSPPVPPPTTDNIEHYADVLKQSGASFKDIQTAFENWSKGKDLSKIKGWKAFKRWEEFWRERLMPDGSFPSGDLYWQAIVDKRNQKKANSSSKTTTLQTTTGTWTYIGNTSVPTNGGGSGRVNCVTFHPTNSNIIWAGAPAGGLWRSTTSGSSWTTTTDELSTLGISDIAFDPSDAQIAYIATGDRDARDTYGVGVLKSTDGGSTWNATGLTNNRSDLVTCNRILVHPTQTTTIICATSNSIRRSINGGTSWSSVLSGNWYDLEFNPTNPNIIYAGSYSSPASIARSTDAGATWTTITSGLPTTGTNRVALAVSAANTNIVYAVYSRGASGGNGVHGFFGLYMSTDAGLNWTQQSTTPNIFGWNLDGSGSGGQGWYDLCIAVSPTNANEVFVGGVNIWRSSNAGVNWTANSMWYTGTGTQYVHADHHDLAYRPGTNTLYSANDGGVFVTTNSGTLWTDISHGLSIMMFYDISIASQANSTMTLGGTQDNGTNLRSGGSLAWDRVYGGDGMENLIDYSDSNDIICSVYFGNFYRSINKGNTFSVFHPSALGNTGAWVTPILQNPNNPSGYFAGYNVLATTTNAGTSWTQSSSVFGGSNINCLDVAPSNSSILYASAGNQLERTINGGTSWTANISPTTQTITHIEISPTNPDSVWVTAGGWSSGNKVWVSANGGTSWTNISSGLPNVPTQCIVYENNSNDGIYIGTDIGVYYRNRSMSNWIPFDTGLPNTICRDMEIYYPTKKLRLGTYGRGLWESDLFVQRPTANFSANTTTICAGDTITFTDLSTNATSIAWTFTGGTPGTSVANSIRVLYSTPGVYQVRLIATNQFASDTITRSAFVTVNALPTATISANKLSACFRDSIVLTAPDAMSSYSWSTGESTQSITLKNPGTFSRTCTVVNSNGCRATSAPISVTINSLPQFTITVTGSTNICTGDSIRLEAPTGYSQYLWNNGQTSRVIFVKTAGHYNILATDTFGCADTASVGVAVTVNPTPATGVTASGLPTICAGDTVTLTAASGNFDYLWSNGGTTRAIAVTTAGQYSVQVTDKTTNCKSTSEIIPIVVNPRPTPRLNRTGTVALCQGQSLRITPGSQYPFYEWSNGRSDSVLTISLPGSYWVRVGNSNGCLGFSDTITVTLVQDIYPEIIPLSPTSICVGDSVRLDAGAGYSTYQWSHGPSTRFVTIRNGGSYWVQKNLDGCGFRSDTIDVIVEDSLRPRVVSSTGVLSFCEGSSIMLDAGAGYSRYRWSTNESTRTISVATGGTYSVQVFSAAGCNGTTSVNIATLQIPNKPIITRKNPDTLSVFNIENGIRYQWTRNDTVLVGSTNTTYIPTQSGRHGVIANNTNNCDVKSDAFDIVVSVDNDTFYDNTLSSMEIIPNPVVDDIIIRASYTLPHALQNVIIEIVDINGHIVRRITEKVTNQQILSQTISLSGFPAGAYFARITANGTQLMGRAFVKY